MNEFYGFNALSLTMNHLNRRHAFLAVAATLATWQAQASDETPAPLTTHTRVQLQAAMQQHIDRIASTGAYPALDLRTGQVRLLQPASGHPMVLQMASYYVLCTTFHDEAGKPVNADFYLLKGPRGFAVFQTEFDNRAPLDGLVKSGVARMLK
jgi:hypothetical protein